MKIDLDLDSCIGSGSCEMLAPDVFTVNDDGVVELVNPNPGEDRRSVVEAAATACPTNVISVS